jgi:hypothetical protein
MAQTFRELLSEKLICGAMDSARDRQAMRRSLNAVPMHARGRRQAVASLQTAELFESAVLWLGWRLQPRQIDWVERHHV